MRAFDFMAEARDLLSDSAGDFWTDTKLLRHLNRALRDVSSRARTIREANYRRVNEGQSVYALPETFLGNDKIAWLHAGYWYPLHRRSLSQVEFINNSDVIRSWRPFYYDIWGRARFERLVSRVSAVSFDGFPTHSQTYGFAFADGTPGVDDVRVGDIVQNVGVDAEGTITEIGQVGPGIVRFASELLVGGERQVTDDAVEFSGVEFGIGLMGLGTNQELAYRLEIRDSSDVVVRNLDIEAVIVSADDEAYPEFGGTVDPHRLSRLQGHFVFRWDGIDNDGNLVASGEYHAVVLTAVLSGRLTDPGVSIVSESDTVSHRLVVDTAPVEVQRGRIVVGDEIRIISPHTVAHALRVSPPPPADSDVGQEVLWVYLSRAHYEVTQSLIDNFNDELELDIELQTVALHCFLYWARMEELGASDPETITQKQLYESEYHRALPYVRQRNREHESTWGKPSLDYMRSDIELQGVAAPGGHAFNVTTVG